MHFTGASILLKNLEENTYVAFILKSAWYVIECNVNIAIFKDKTGRYK